VFTQLQYFQENKERLGIIVDEYGEVQGLVTLDDIIEEMIGEFTTSMPGDARADTLAGPNRASACSKAHAAARHQPPPGPETSRSTAPRP
jgi:Mg2+/Co2+ transporter CorB